MPAAKRLDPYQAFNFIVEIEGLPVGGFSEVTGLSSETAIIEYREGADRVGTVRKIPGLTRYANIVLKRGVSADRTLWQWRKTVIDGSTQRRDGAIVLLNEERSPVARWTFRAGWPAKWEVSALSAKASEVAIETLEIAHEGLDLE